MTTSPISGPEPVSDAALATLQALMPATIDAENVKHSTDGRAITLDQIVSWSFGGSDIYAYPSIEVAIPDVELGSFSIAQLRADSILRTQVRCSVNGPDSDTIYRMICRYSDCILNCLFQPNAFGAGLVIDISQSNPVRLRYRGWTLDGNDPGQVDLFGACLVEVLVSSSEARS